MPGICRQPHNPNCLALPAVLKVTQAKLLAVICQHRSTKALKAAQMRKLTIKYSTSSATAGRGSGADGLGADSSGADGSGVDFIAHGGKPGESYPGFTKWRRSRRVRGHICARTRAEYDCGHDVDVSWSSEPRRFSAMR
jgi:hypothetical protein